MSENDSIRVGNNWKHGHTVRREFTKLYIAWASMKIRCTNPNHQAYPWYGGKGIKVCSRWEHDFLAFAKDVGAPPSSLHTLGRVDGTKDYEPGNVHWETRLDQSRNQSSNHALSLGGRTQCLSAWAAEIGITPSAISARLKAGWSVERALTQGRCHNGGNRPGCLRRFLTFGGQTLPLSEWASRLGITPRRLRDRLKEGWSISRALTTQRRSGPASSALRGCC